MAAKDKISTQANIGVALSEEEKLQIEQEAREEVEAELKATKVAEFKMAAKSRLKKKALFSEGTDEDGEDTVRITLNLAPVQPCITLDGKKYHHGRSYVLSKGVAQSLNDIQFRGWKEESARLGEDMNAFYGRQKMNAQVGPQGLRKH